MYWLLSYPRSGNTFVRYCVEYLSKHPTVDWPAICERVGGMGVDMSKPVIMFKSHTYNPKNHDIEGCDGLIFIIRDYKEVIVRHNKEGDRKFATVLDRFMAETVGVGNTTGADYIAALQAYDQRKNKKMIVYYEDLITNTKGVVTDIAKFMNLDNEYLKEFVNNIDKHKKLALTSYHSRSHTGGKDIKYHQKSIGPDVLLKMTNHLKAKYPDLFDKYLRRYE